MDLENPQIYKFQSARTAYYNAVHDLSIRGGRVRWPGKSAPRALRGKVRRAFRAMLKARSELHASWER